MKSHIAITTFFIINSVLGKLEKRALQKAHEKSKIESLLEKFPVETGSDENTSLANLLTNIFNTYLSNCNPIFLYDKESTDYYQVLEILFTKLNTTFTHGIFSETDVTSLKNKLTKNCFNYILFINDVFNSKNLTGKQSFNKVILITRSSQWRVNEFLSSDSSTTLINLVVIAPSTVFVTTRSEPSYILYTHELYVDGLGSSAPKVLTAWRNGSLTRSGIKLFSQKMKNGFSGHRFITLVAHQPPFVIKKGLDENDEVLWDGTEIRLLKLLSELYNFTIDIKIVKQDYHKSLADKIVDNVNDGLINMGLSGIYLTMERLVKVDVSYPHSYDCASFISLTSTALPRYRAIMGPFHWSVWLILTIAYLFAIFPLAFADKLSLKHLLKKPEEMENMFWYVFGTFTNCFTFGKETWTRSSKITPRVLIGFYWIFTIITTACYTGSIIAFITIPLYPETVDTVPQLLSGRYRIGTLDKGGWQFWFKDSTDAASQKLLKKLELLPDIQSGLKNITKAFFWPYAFLGSRAQLDYIVQTNFTTNGKRSLFHISSECFVPFGVSIVFAKNSVYKEIIDKGISYIIQSGLMTKFQRDIKWDFMRSPTGKLLQASSVTSLKNLSVEDRSLTLDDTQGIFLLLGTGFLLGIFSLIFEAVGGCFRCCKRRRTSTTSSLATNPRLQEIPTSRQRINRENLLGNGKCSIVEGKTNAELSEYTSKKIQDLRKRSKDMRFARKYNFEKYFGEDTRLVTNEIITIQEDI